jgi:hypothetical protein
VGLAGGSFSVGTPYVARWFPKPPGLGDGRVRRRQLRRGGQQVRRPVLLVVAFGWTMVPQVYAAIMLGTVILFWFFSTATRSTWCRRNVKFSDQLKMLKDPKVLKYCQYYSIVFGGYVALALWMVQYYVGEFGLDIRPRRCWPPASRCPAACCAPSAAGCRQVRRAQRHLVGAVGELDLPVPAELPADRLHGAHRQRPPTFHIGLNVYAFTALMFVLGIAWAFGKASVFKYISDDYPDQHRHRQRHRRPGRRPGRLRAADHVRRADGPHRHPLQRLHADVRRGLGLADLDVLDRSARTEMMGTNARRRPCRAVSRAESTRRRCHECHHDSGCQVRPQPGYRPDIADWRPGGRHLLGSHGQEDRLPQPLDLGARAAVRLRGLGHVGNHHRADAQPGLSPSPRPSCSR